MVMRLLFLALILFSISCKKDDTGIVFTLPAITQTGKNSFGLKLNNSVWTNYGQVCFPLAGGCRENLKGSYFNDGDIQIHADRVIQKNGSRYTSETINITLKTNFNGTRIYSTLTNDDIGMHYSYAEVSRPEKVYITAIINPNLTIKLTKLDSVNKIISGEFSAVLYNRAQDTTNAISTTDSLIITDGRFDIKMNE